MLNLKNTNMSMEQLRKVAPTIFQTNSMESTSDKYVHIPTYRVVEDIMKLGWEVVDAKEVKARKNVGFQKHLIVFRNPNLIIRGEEGDDVFPQILLTNSHDGKNAFRFTAGIFRMVCENGLVVSTKEFENIAIRHMNYTFEEVEKTVMDLIEKLPLTIDSMNKLKSKTMTQKEIEKFAKDALNLRFDKTIGVDMLELITPNRKEDTGNDMWSVFNVIQEKLINGDFTYLNDNGKTRKARKIKNFQQDIKLNQELFDLALEYVN
jgi:hypothetical protein